MTAFQEQGLNNSVLQAITVLLDATLDDPTLIPAAAGIEIVRRFPLVISQPVTDQGIPFGQLTAGNNTINLNLIPDFLRDVFGKILMMHTHDAVEALTAFNGGTKNGNGFAEAIIESVIKGEFKDGTLILVRKPDLLKLSTEYNTNPAFKEISEIVSTSSLIDNWCVSSTELSNTSSKAFHVNLKDGSITWTDKINLFSHGRVLALRGFNVPAGLNNG